MSDMWEKIQESMREARCRLSFGVSGAPDATFCMECGHMRFFLLAVMPNDWPSGGDNEPVGYVCYGCADRPANVGDESAELLMAKGEIKDVY